jgi:hypothetical protein
MNSVAGGTLDRGGYRTTARWHLAAVAKRRTFMKRTFKVGDHVTWNSEAGHVSGTIIKVHTKDVDYKGYTHHASKDEPQYEIQSDKTDHIAMHKGTALRRKSG